MPLESPADDPRTQVLRDPRVIRALAHPVRLDLYVLMGRQGPHTAAEAGRRLGISQALASHHLRQLAKYGFVEPAPGTDNRERPWRVVATSLTWRGAERSSEGAVAADLLEQVFIEAAVSRYIQWQQDRRSAEPQWRETTGSSFNFVYLTQAELEELVSGLDALIKPYVDARPMDEPGTRPAGSVPVDLTYLVSIVPEVDNFNDGQG